MRIIGLRETIDPSREYIGNCTGFFPAYGSPSTSFLPNMHFQCCVILEGNLGGNFDIFTASGESTAWMLLWKTRSRQIGVRVCLVRQFNFCSTAFDPRAWTMFVFWKENLGRKPHLITPENEGGDETSYPCPPKLFDDPDVLFGPSGPPEHPRPPEPPGQPGPPPGWPPAPSPAGDGARVGPESTSRERLPLRPSPPEPQLLPMNDDDDDQPPQEERQRWRSRSRERVYPHAQVPQEQQTQPVVTPEAEEFSDMNPSSTATGPPTSAEMRGRSRRDERSRSRERTPPHSSSQNVDEDSATVDPQNRVSNRSMSPQEQGGSRRQDPHQQKGKKTVAEKEPSRPSKAKKHKSIDSDEDDEEPRNEPGTSSNTQTWCTSTSS